MNMSMSFLQGGGGEGANVKDFLDSDLFSLPAAKRIPDFLFCLVAVATLLRQVFV